MDWSAQGPLIIQSNCQWGHAYHLNSFKILIIRLDWQNQHTACPNCFSTPQNKNPQHSGDSSGEEGHGCLPFLLAYLLLLLLLGLPIILLELFLGQYSALPPGRSDPLNICFNLWPLFLVQEVSGGWYFKDERRLYRHLSPLLRGLGPAICIQAGVRWAFFTFSLVFTFFCILFFVDLVQVGVRWAFCIFSLVFACYVLIWSRWESVGLFIIFSFFLAWIWSGLTLIGHGR